MISALKGPGEVEAEILMTRQAFSGSFFVVEGDDDSRFWSARIAPSDCELVIAGGKPAVVGGVTRLDKRSFQGVVGLVDDDCDRLLGLDHGSPNILHTDVRDLEGLLLRSSAFDKLLSEFGDPKKISSYEAGGQSVREGLVARAVPLGKLRWYSYIHGLGVDCKKLPPARFTDQATWNFDENRLLRDAISLGGLPDLPELESALSRLVSPDAWQVCHGHDLVSLLSIGLSCRLGNRTPGYDRIASVLRSGMETLELSKLGIYMGLQAWESNNPPFRVLRDR